jgi:hypothetical protein
MADVTLIPDGTTETQFTQAAGDLLILAAGDLLNVEGAPAVELEEPNTALLNDGAITASGAPAVLGDEASVRIVNGGGDPAASITSDDSAILLAPLNGATQEITNLGTIDGAFNGVDFQGAAGSSSKLFNAGLVTSESRALNIVADDVQVVNQGTFETTADPRNGVFYTDTQADATTLVNGADGVIDAGAGNDGDAVSLQVGNDVDLSVSNAGVFQGRGEPEGGGEASGLRILPGTEPNPGFNGTLLNKGLIASEATTGVGAGVLVEDGIDADGQLVNQGRITGPFNGLYLGDGDYADFVVFNGANGLITSASRAVNIDGDGLTLVNAGEISHTGDARNGVVYADDTADGYSISNTATGRIDAGEGLNGDAISLQLGDEVHADITNAGHVLGRGEAVLSGLASGVRLFSGAEDGSSIFRGEIDNSGRITSEATTGISAGILVEDGVSFRGEIHNSGEIAGPFNGIYIGDSDHELTLTNAEGGRISSDSRAVNIGGDGVTLINHGEILGTGDSRNGVVYSDDESNLFEVVNTSTGVIDAGKGNDGHAVSVELAVRSEGLIDNAGLLFGRGDSAGIRLFSNPETAGPDGSVFAGQILSEGTIRTEGGPGILIEENVAVRADGDDAAVVITGDVIADLALDATAMTTGLVFTQALGHIAGDLRFGAGDDDVTIADADLGGGGSVDGEIHLRGGDDSLDALDAETDLEVAGGEGADEILTGAGDDLVTGDAGDDAIFSGAGDDIVLGGDGDDAIDGGAGFDTLAGGDGDDELFAGAGLDLVSGGDGADTFFFAPISDIDVITDFDADEGDVIDLTLFETFASGDAAYAAGSDVGGDAVWDFGDGNTLTLANTDYAALSGDDFIV